MSFTLRLAAVLSAALILAGCTTAEGDTVADQRQAIQEMKQDALTKLYSLEPKARTQVQQAVGYAVFSNVGVSLLVVSTGSGYGVVEDLRTGGQTYMKMLSGGVGLGLGVKDFRGVFVFTTEEALEDFVENGWTASADADVAAKSGEKGGAWAGAADIAPGIKLYQITENGLALQAAIQGTKYWKDDELNANSDLNS